MENPENFCLKWNDFPHHLHSTFTGLLSPSSGPVFSDITLTCEDGKQVSAHRLVLAGCSPVLRTILTSTELGVPQARPHLYLRGVSSIDLSSLLAFMYQGEVSLPHHQLHSFLAVAEDLKVKGLVDTETGSNKVGGQDAGKSRGDKHRKYEKIISKNIVRSEPDHSGTKFRSKENPTSREKNVSVKLEKMYEANATEEMYLEPDPYNKYVISNVSEEEREQGNFEDYENGDIIQDHLSASTPSFSEKTWPDGRTEWTCSLCGKVFHHPGSTSQHIAVHQGRTTCSECGKVFNRVSDMRTHSRNVHQIYEIC